MESMNNDPKKRDEIIMKRLISIFCMIGLVCGIVSAAGAVPYTTTLDFTGSAEYIDQTSDSQPAEPTPLGLDSELSPLFDSVLLPLFSQLPPSKGEIDYTIDWNLPDSHMNYLWSLDVYFWYGFAQNSINKSYTNSFNLGTFALEDYNAEINQARNFIEDLPNPGTFGPVSYALDGDWQKGKIYFGLYAAILDGVSEWSIDPQIFFGGNIDLTANAAPVPEPASLLLLGSGLIGLAGYSRKQFNKNRSNS
jgi:hypothetical protein